MEQTIRHIVFLGIDMSIDEWCPHCDNLLFETGDLFDILLRMSYFNTTTKIKATFSSKTKEEIEEEIEFNRFTQKFLKNVDISYDTSRDELVCDSCDNELRVRHDERLVTDSIFQNPDEYELY
jgi:hypothetical protein